MNILALGDVISGDGLENICSELRNIKFKYKIDIVIANGENSAVGNGMLPKSVDALFSSGVDVVTGGNHSFNRREIYDTLESMPFLIRPANYPSSAPGKGSCVLDFGRVQVGVINICGVVFLPPLDDPFAAIDREIARLNDAGAKIIICDIHAEATAEKLALAHYIDGRVSAVFGTHTHVQTADEQILPRGTGYITDAGMCGVQQSIIGIKPELSIAKIKNKLPVKFEVASGTPTVNGCIFTIDEGTALCSKIVRINI